MGKADISINNWLENKTRFADLFNGIIFEGKQIIQPEDLKKISPVASVSIKNRSGKQKILKKFLPNYKINLIDAQRFQNANRFQSDLQIIFNMLKCRENKQDLEEYIYKHEDYFSNVDDETRQALKAFLGIEKIPGEDIIQKGENMNMCKAIQEMYDDGYECKLIELVIKKMKKNQSIENIADALEEDKEVIQAIYNAVNSCGIDSPAKEIRLKMME